MAFKKPYIEGDVRYGHTFRSKERKQQGQLEAARSKTRVEGLKKRFSVAKSSRQATADSHAGKANKADPRLSRFANGGVDSGMEMSQLPPPPTTGDSSKAEGSSIRTMKKNRPGGSDATPR
jgi:palmitoyltransferase ZDHHC9/14/18